MSFTSTNTVKDSRPEPFIYLPFKNSYWEGKYPTKPEFPDTVTTELRQPYMVYCSSPVGGKTRIGFTSKDVDTGVVIGFTRFRVPSDIHDIQNLATPLDMGFNSTPYASVHLSASDSSINLTTMDGTSTNTYAIGSFNLDEDKSVAIIIQGTTVAAYVDGTHVGDYMIAPPTNQLVDYVEQRVSSSYYPRCYHAWDLMVFDEPLTAQDIADIHAGTYPLELTMSGSYIDHTHTESEITDLDKYTQSEVDSLLAGKASSSHTHTTSNITNFTEATQDLVGAMVTGNNETGITVTYDDTNGKLDFAVSGGSGAWLYAERVSSFKTSVDNMREYVNNWDSVTSSGSADISFNTATGALTLQPGVYRITFTAEAYAYSSSDYIKTAIYHPFGSMGITNYVSQEKSFRPRTTGSTGVITQTRIFQVTSTRTLYLSMKSYRVAYTSMRYITLTAEKIE